MIVPWMLSNKVKAISEKIENLRHKRNGLFPFFLARGEESFNQKKYDEALQVFEKVIEENPSCVDAYVDAANVYIDQERYEEALDIVERGIEANGEIDALVELKEKIEGLLSANEDETVEEEEEPVGEAEEFTQEYKELYADFVRNHDEYDPDFPTRFELIYIDEDDIPELAMANGFFHPDMVTVFSIINGKVEEVCAVGEFGWMEYVDHGSKIHYTYNGSGANDDHYGSIKNGEYEETLDLFKVTDYAVVEEGVSTYAIDDREVSKSEYENVKNSMMGNYKVCAYDDFHYEWENITISRTMHDINDDEIERYIINF